MRRLISASSSGSLLALALLTTALTSLGCGSSEPPEAPPGQPIGPSKQDDTLLAMMEGATSQPAELPSAKAPAVATGTASAAVAAPSGVPSGAPSGKATAKPTAAPTAKPTAKPSAAPTAKPTSTAPKM